MPAERGAGAVLGDERVAEVLCGQLDPGGGLVAQRHEERRDGRAGQELLVGEIVGGAEAGDAALGGVLLVRGFLQRDLADRREKRLLFGAAQEILLIDQPVREGLEQVLQLAAFSRMVTNSSAAVGWMPMVASNCALVAPTFTAIAMPWMISPASGPIMCAPTTRWLARSTT